MKETDDEGAIVYNVTTKVDRRVAIQWLHWLKQEHIPEIIATGCFTHATIFQLVETDETDGPTYAIQYHAKNKTLYNRYITTFAEAIRKKAIDKWGDQFISFRSVLRVVN